MAKRITKRTPKRLIRLAYDLEHLASNLRAEGFDSIAETVLHCSGTLGDVGRSLDDKLDK